MGVMIERYVHQANIDHYRRLAVESERDRTRDEDRHAMLPTLLAEEIAKDKVAQGERLRRVPAEGVQADFAFEANLRN